MAKVVMDVFDTKTCRIVPKKNRFVPDVLLQNKRIEEETTMDLNKAEIRRAMSFAEVYIVGDDGEELATEESYFLKDEQEKDSVDNKDTSSTPTPARMAPTPEPTKTTSTPPKTSGGITNNTSSSTSTKEDKDENTDK